MTTHNPRLHVAVAVIQNDRKDVLITRRPDHVHQGGLWEFPCGKVEPDETVRLALVREIRKVTGIDIQDARPLITVAHEYHGKDVLLDAWRVTRYQGGAESRENQSLEWAPVRNLAGRRFSETIDPILKALQLPSHYLITPEPADMSDYMARLERAFEDGIRLVQLRAKRMDESGYSELATAVCELAARYETQVMLNEDPGMVDRVGAQGIHLSSVRLMQCTRRPLAAHLHVSASCHTALEIEQANRVGVDFAVVSPVMPTRSHPGVAPIGWEGFRRLAAAARYPVYALGGMRPDLCERAWQYGAQGIAAIRALWPANV